LHEYEETKTAENDDWDENLENMKNPITVDGDLYVNVFPIVNVK
jgi:hypothetical protein